MKQIVALACLTGLVIGSTSCTSSRPQPMAKSPQPTLLATPKVYADALDWGTESEGIQCAIRPAKSVFTTGEFIVVDVLYRNTATHAKTVCIRPDPLWQWMKYRIDDASRNATARSPIADGIDMPLERADFRTIQPGETAVCRTRTEAIWLTPGQYRVTVEINTINRISRIIHGFDKFCQENGLSLWIAPIRSGEGTFTVQEMPPIQWGEAQSNSLACGVGAVEITEGRVIIPVFMKNTGTDSDRNYFDGTVFAVELDGQNYVPADWPARNARQFHIPKGREIGPIPLGLDDFISETDKDRWQTAPRPLSRLPPGPHRLRVFYVGKNGSPRIAFPEVTVTGLRTNK